MTGQTQMPPARQVALPGGGWLSVHEQAGAGPALLFLHGFTDSAHSFALLLPHLRHQHVILPDLRGHGASFRGDIASIDALAEDIEAMISTMGLTRPILIGHSMGALIAVAIAARRRVAVRGLMTICGSLRPAGPTLARLSARFAALPRPVPASHPFLDDWYACGSAVPHDFLAALRASCVAMRREDWLACLTALQEADLTSGATGLDGPVAVLNGGEDQIFTKDHQDALTAALRPDLHVTFAGVGHNPHWEAPSDVAGLVQRLCALCA